MQVGVLLFVYDVWFGILIVNVCCTVLQIGIACLTGNEQLKEYGRCVSFIRELSSELDGYRSRANNLFREICVLPLSREERQRKTKEFVLLCKAAWHHAFEIGETVVAVIASDLAPEALLADIEHSKRVAERIFFDMEEMFLSL